MGRRITGRVPGTVWKYIPKAFDNDKDPDPVVVWIKHPSEGDRRQCYTSGAGSSGRDRLNDFATMVCRSVDKVENYDGPAGPISTGAEFVQYAEHALFWEIADAIESDPPLSGDEQKKSEGSSD